MRLYQTAKGVYKMFFKMTCGRETYDLKYGDTVMDNGACLQLSTRWESYGFVNIHPRVSKAEFKRFKKCTDVKEDLDHDYGKSMHLWVYRPSKFASEHLERLDELRESGVTDIDETYVEVLQDDFNVKPLYAREVLDFWTRALNTKEKK